MDSRALQRHNKKLQAKGKKNAPRLAGMSFCDYICV
jgi:hypothetical protein